MDIPDHELEQLYAARYRNDTPFTNSPILRDSLENSSDGGLSRMSSLRSSGIHKRYFHPRVSNINSDMDKGKEQRNSSNRQHQHEGLLRIVTDRHHDEAVEDSSHSVISESKRRFEKFPQQSSKIFKLANKISPNDNYQVSSTHKFSRKQKINQSVVKTKNTQSPEYVSPKFHDRYTIKENEKNLAQPAKIHSLKKKKSSNSSVQSHQNVSEVSSQPRKNYSTSPERISKLFHGEPLRTDSPVSSAIRNLMAYHQQEDVKSVHSKEDVMRSTVDNLVRKEHDIVQPPTLPPRRPTLLRVVTENQMLESSSPTPVGISPSIKLVRHSSTTPSDRSAQSSPPYLYGEKGNIKSINSPRRSLDGKYQDHSLGNRSNSRRPAYRSYATPSPLGKTEPNSNEFNNPAGLLAFVTRDSNSPRVERTVTGLLKTSYCSSPEYDASLEPRDGTINQMQLFELPEPGSLSPVKVLPSKLDSMRVAEMFRGFQRSSASNDCSPRQKLLEENLSHPPTLIIENESPKEKRGSGIVKTISRSISKRKNSIRLTSANHDELIDDTDSCGSECSRIDDLDINGQSSPGHRSNMNYKPFIDESDNGSGKGSSRSGSFYELHNENNELSATTVKNSLCIHNKEKLKVLKLESLSKKIEEDKKEITTKDQRQKFWSFTTKVVFPKRK